MTKNQKRAMASALRTLNAIKWLEFWARVRDRLNAKRKSGPRWT